MNSRIILLMAGISALASCGTAYRAGQTPDDVYYSPAPEAAAYVRAESRNDEGGRYNDNEYRNNNYYDNPDDYYLRMKVRDRYRWSVFNDYGMNDWRYAYNYHNYNPWAYSSFNNYWNWNNFYNPYYHPVVVIHPTINPAQYNKVRNFNLNSYTNKNYYTPNGSIAPRYYDPHQQVGNRNNGSLGNSVRKVFSGNNSSNTNKNSYYNNSQNNNTQNQSERPTRTYTPPANNNSSSGGSNNSSGGSSGGGGVSRPTRG